MASLTIHTFPVFEVHWKVLRAFPPANGIWCERKHTSLHGLFSTSTLKFHSCNARVAVGMAI